MSIFGIVSEFNPFHRGHEYLISCAKKMGAEAVVCVMSGNSTQRGELAIVDKYLRAEAAVSGGADLVLELPFPWSSASAEGFALAAISILSSFCDTVIFGSECGDIDLLRRAADFTFSKSFKERFSELLSNGEQSAFAYITLVETELGIKLSSNDILGVEYIKAAKTLGCNIHFLTVKREGSAYLCDEANSSGFDSAMALRKMLSLDEDIVDLSERLPERSFELITEAKKSGKISDTSKYTEFARMYFRLFEPWESDSFAESGGGVLERICRVAHDSSSPDEFFTSLSTKRYTDAKLRRAILFAMCKVKAEDLKGLPAYTLLLGANELGRNLLSKKRRAESIKVITKPSDVGDLCDEGSIRQRQLDIKLASIYNFCLEVSQPTCQSMKKKPYIT